MDGPRLVYIFSAGHSGSTMLGSILGAHPRAFYLGEIGNLPAYRRHTSKSHYRVCTCGAHSLGDCPFWNAVDRQLRQTGALSIPALQVANRTGRIEHDAPLLQAAASVAGADVVVDATKNYHRALRLLGLPLPLIAVILVADPRKIVQSMKHTLPWWKHATRLNRIGIRMWTIRRLARSRKLPCAIVSYDRLASDPAAVAARLTNLAGLEFVPDQLDWTRRPRHDLGGNRMRYGERAAIAPDRSWHAELNLAQKILIPLLSLPYIAITRLLLRLERH